MQWLRRSFIAGFFVTVPMFISVAAVLWLFRLIDGFVRPFYFKSFGTEPLPGLGLATTALAIVLVGAVYETVQRRAPGMAWLIAGVLVSLVAGLVQARRLALHRQFNHNDLYHVIQMVALYAFFRGGALLVDR